MKGAAVLPLSLVQAARLQRRVHAADRRRCRSVPESLCAASWAASSCWYPLRNGPFTISQSLRESGRQHATWDRGNAIEVSAERTERTVLAQGRCSPAGRL